MRWMGQQPASEQMSWPSSNNWPYEFWKCSPFLRASPSIPFHCQERRPRWRGESQHAFIRKLAFFRFFACFFLIHPLWKVILSPRRTEKQLPFSHLLQKQYYLDLNKREAWLSWWIPSIKCSRVSNKSYSLMLTKHSGISRKIPIVSDIQTNLSRATCSNCVIYLCQQC